MRTSLLFLFIFSVSLSFSQTSNPAIANALKWRCIGPFRGGRTVGAVGVVQQPHVFYMGVNNGGVWKTTDDGRTWKPIFDDQPTGSIGDVAVAPSNPNYVYVASGEGLQRPDLSVGNGMYRSIDAGKSWQHLGLENVQQIGGIAIDPKNELVVYVAALGHPYGPNVERGIYKTIDGGNHWEKVLYFNENAGAIQVAVDPSNNQVVYANIWSARQGPWENGAWNGAESGLFKSIDGGAHWVQLKNGLPNIQDGLGRIGFCIAPSNSNRLYATVDASKNGGIYRSDDAGASWYLINEDPRLWGRGADFAEIKADPQNPDIVYSANVVTWKSMDGGRNWTAFRGAPGGDDYHRIWIHPNDSKIIMLASDQGAIITVNGGETFSSWYNQPTAQFYHVSTDNQFPYNVYGGQQESGSVGISSRGNDGHINLRDWHPVGVEEYGYVAADPLNPDIIYGGKITKYNKKTGQVQHITPEAIKSGKYRYIRTAPVIFSPVDKKSLYFSGNVLFKTMDGGNHWEVISPDLTRETWEVPASVGIYMSEDLKKMPRRGVIYTVAPSYKTIQTIWAGTDDGLIHITRDGGKNWKNITPSDVTSWSKVSMIEASHFDDQTAYAAVNRIRCDDMNPHIYKTHDGGKTWEEIVVGLAKDPINTVREDPVVKGLLYAGSERMVYYSLDDGAHWHSLRGNMPATSIRDLVIKDEDIVVGTHGRSFWILDDISPLRQAALNTSSISSKLYKPRITYRVRWNMNTDTPIPQEEPAGDNPPDGAIIYYNLDKEVKDLQLEIFDAKGTLIRKFTNHDLIAPLPPVNIPTYWVRPETIISSHKGAHRWIWDLKYAPLQVPATFPISATYQNTAPDPTAPWVMPGVYKLKLTTDGTVSEQSFEVRMDPRIKISREDLQTQHDLSLICYQTRKKIIEAKSSLSDLKVNKEDKKAITLDQLEQQLSSLFNQMQDTDFPVLARTKTAVKDVVQKWNSLEKVPQLEQ